MTKNEKIIVNQALDILDSHLKEKSITIDNPDTIKNYLRLHLELEEREIFGVLFLDAQHKLISLEKLFMGSIHSVQVHPAVVARNALILNASAVIYFHNHPSGSPNPSHADRVITKRLVSALDIFEIRSLDHLIIAKGIVTSFAEQGLI
ncbi:JAB domain-containing protein [Photorhabdus luminescens]|uniref:JAB domain-containing protein n=1 Tax=Photorhabdus luminescens TaxID=29488 RepID=UPI00223F6C12|nr:DNA repair protein RadC [Photorhabdus luminescens]MCW7763386.1 DNA repair protein RadC [Photorhabdus luminescens subsp. venezuelensis]